MVKDDDLFPPNQHGHRFERPPQLVCLPCGKALFGPIIRPFDLIANEECEICAAAGQVVPASVFRDYAEMFSRR